MTTFLLFAAAGWTFQSAQLANAPATGRELGDGALELRIPSRTACGWCSKPYAVDASGGAVRFSATAEIALDQAGAHPYNDVMMFVMFCHPKDGVKRKGEFFKRDFVAYTDAAEGGRIVRKFDETFNLPEGCTDVKVEFVGKWHPMTVKVSGVRVERAERLPPRRVRCVVGNPHQRPVDWSVPAKGMAHRLGQIEATLTNIFAHVEKPDIILFSECFVSSGAPDPSTVTERIPGGPSWNLAVKYAVPHHVNIAMNVKERTDEGTCHNTVFVVDRQGRLAGKYRKVHLTSGEYMQGLVPGDGFPIFDLDFGRVGALVCWDNWFSESIKLVKRAGAELLLFPLAGCGQDHVDFCWPSRTIDAGIPMMIAMRSGDLPNGILNRDGTWADKTFVDNGFAVADIDLAERRPAYWLSVGPGMGDPYQLYYDESRPEIYRAVDWTRPRR